MCGDSIDLVDGYPTGSVRISFGYMSTFEDAQRFLNFIEQCFVDNRPQIAEEDLASASSKISPCTTVGTHEALQVSTTGSHSNQRIGFPATEWDLAAVRNSESVRETQDLAAVRNSESVRETQDLAAVRNSESVRETQDLAVIRNSESVRETQDLAVIRNSESVRETQDLAAVRNSESVRETQDLAVIRNSESVRETQDLAAVRNSESVRETQDLAAVRNSESVRETQDLAAVRNSESVRETQDLAAVRNSESVRETQDLVNHRVSCYPSLRNGIEEQSRLHSYDGRLVVGEQLGVQEELQSSQNDFMSNGGTSADVRGGSDVGLRVGEVLQVLLEGKQGRHRGLL